MLFSTHIISYLPDFRVLYARYHFGVTTGDIIVVSHLYSLIRLKMYGKELMHIFSRVPHKNVQPSETPADLRCIECKPITRQFPLNVPHFM